MVIVMMSIPPASGVEECVRTTARATRGAHRGIAGDAPGRHRQL
jgi:hypothetical protein